MTDQWKDKIERYLEAELSDEESLAFEQAMKADEDLAAAVRLHQKAKDLLEAHAWVATKEEVKRLNLQRKKSSRAVLRLAAALVGLLLVTGWLLNRQYSDPQLYADYFEPYPDRITVLGAEEDAVSKAMDLYNRSQYEAAAQAFGELREAGNSSDLLLLYEAIALQKSDQAVQSIELLQANPTSKTALEAAYAWNLIMAHLAADKGEEAYQLLLTYESKGYAFQKDKAAALKEDLKSFWRF